MSSQRSLRRVVIAAVAVLVMLAAVTPAPAAVELRLPGLGGGELTTANVARGATVIVVWASWSPRCRDIVERVNALDAALGGKARVVTVDFQEEPPAVEAFLAGKGLRAPVFLDRDGEFSKSHEVTTLPGLIVIRDGEVRFRGKLPADPAATVSEALN